MLSVLRQPPGARRPTATADDEPAERRRTTARPSSRCRRRGGRRAATRPFGKNFEGVIPNLRRRYEEGSWAVQEDLEAFRMLRECPDCHGHRLKAQSLAVKVKGRGIADYVSLPISEAVEVFDAFELTEREALIASRVLREIRERAARSCTTSASAT